MITIPTFLAGLGIVLVKILIVVIVVFLAVAYLSLAERKVSAHIQVRWGPMKVGSHGWLQPIADGIKLFLKEDIIPLAADAPVYVISPIIILVAALLVFVTIPFGPGLYITDLNIGLLFILAVSSMGVYGIVMGGWSSNNKYSLMGGLRSASQMISYEVPLALAVIGVVMQAGSLSMVEIVEAQRGLYFGFIPKWFLFWAQPLAFFIFLVASLAENNRLPFDLPEAEAELVAGFFTEYSGMKFAFYFLAEYANMIVVASIGTILFLGGWLAPPLWLWVLVMGPFIILAIRGGNFIISTVVIFILGVIFIFIPGGVFWFVFKVASLIFLAMWIRWTYPRFRFDQLMRVGWQWLLPLAFLNIIVVGIILNLV